MLKELPQTGQIFSLLFLACAHGRLQNSAVGFVFAVTVNDLWHVAHFLLCSLKQRFVCFPLGMNASPHSSQVAFSGIDISFKVVCFPIGIIPKLCEKVRGFLMKLKNITEIDPKASMCIEVDAPNRLFAAGGEDGCSIVSHNSVVQRNIILGCILRPDSWRFLGIDLKKVELSVFRAYKNVVLGIATTIEEALIVLRFAQETMMKRYAELEQLGLNNFLLLPEKGQALMVMVDEAGELLSPSGVKALSERTPIPLPDGTFKKMSELHIGDTILDNYSKPTKIIDKYEPAEQTKFELTISQDSTKTSEKVIAGAEHNWVAYFEHCDGEVTGPQIVDTKYLHSFKETQAALPPEERVKVKFKKFE